MLSLTLKTISYPAANEVHYKNKKYTFIARNKIFKNIYIHSEI